MSGKRCVALFAIILSLAISGCGGGGGSKPAASRFALTDSSGIPIVGTRALPSGHGVSAALNGLGPNDQAAFIFNGPTGPTQQPPFGLPACSFFSIFSADKAGSLSSQLIVPKLAAGKYSLSVYDVKGSGSGRKGTLLSSTDLTVADSPANVPALDVGSVTGGAFTANRSFTPGNDVYLRGSGLQPGKAVDVYITAHKDSWATNDSLIDVSGSTPNASPNVPDGTRAARAAFTPARTRALRGSVKTVTPDANGSFGPLLVWQAIDAQADQGTFDVIADVNQTGRFDPAHDLVVDQATGSFVVDSINRAAGSNSVTLAYNQTLVPSKSFGQVDNVRSKLSARAVHDPTMNVAGIYVCRHQTSWRKDDEVIDVSGIAGSAAEHYYPIIDNVIELPPMYSYHADLLPGDYDIVINLGRSGRFDPTRDYIDGGGSGPAFTVAGAAGNKKWTVMVYVDGDNNLTSNAVQNIVDMESVTYLDSAGKSDVNVVVQYADNHATAGRYIIAHSTQPNVISTVPAWTAAHLNMADPSELSQFIAWAKQVSPANHYALILWDHGTGFTSRAAPKTLGRNILWSDSFGKQSMTVSQVHDVLKQNGPFDLLACDACLMGMTEVAYEMRDVCSVYTSSEEVEPGHGYDYTAFLSDLVKSPDMSAAKLGTSIVNAYKAYFDANPDPVVNPTSATVDETKLPAITTAMNRLVTSLIDVPSGATESVTQSQANRDKILALIYQQFQFPRFTYADAQDWIKQLKSLHFNATVDGACDDVTSAYSAAVIAEYHAAAQTGAHGLTLWVPNRQTFAFSSEYSDLQFAADARWLEFCGILLSRGSKIDPANAVVTPGGTITFTASTDNVLAPGASLAYRWQTNGAHGQLSDTKGHSGTSFESTDNKVVYTAGAGDLGSDTVTANVIQINGNKKTDFGPAIATVNVASGQVIVNVTAVSPDWASSGLLGSKTLKWVSGTKQFAGDHTNISAAFGNQLGGGEDFRLYGNVPQLVAGAKVEYMVNGTRVDVRVPPFDNLETFIWAANSGDITINNVVGDTIFFTGKVRLNWSGDIYGNSWIDVTLDGSATLTGM